MLDRQGENARHPGIRRAQNNKGLWSYTFFHKPDPGRQGVNVNVNVNKPSMAWHGMK